MVAGYVLHDKKILLVYNKKLEKWLPFGGKIEDSENPDQALHREAKEELNLQIVTFPISPIQSDKPLTIPFDVNVVDIKGQDYTVLYYLCKPTNIDSLQLNDESLAYKWIGVDNVVEIDQPDVQSQCQHIFSLLALQR